MAQSGIPGTSVPSVAVFPVRRKWGRNEGGKREAGDEMRKQRIQCDRCKAWGDGGPGSGHVDVTIHYPFSRKADTLMDICEDCCDEIKSSPLKGEKDE